MTVSTGTEAPGVLTPEKVGVPVEQTRVALARSLRLALLHGRAEASRLAVVQLALASGAEVVARIRATDPGSFVEAAQALRDAKPDVVVIQGGTKDAGALGELLEALRLGCGAQRPMPRVFALVDQGVGQALRLRTAPFEFEPFAAAPELIEALRGLRRGGDQDAVLRDVLIEDAARALAATTGTSALAVDVTEWSTSLVLARPDDRVQAAHLVPLGLGMGADHVVARASLDNVRRWLTSPIDAPALLERMFSRPRGREGAATTSAAVLLEMALAREAIAHALRDVADAGYDVTAMRSAPSILVTGRVASFPTAGQSLLVLVDGLEPSAVSTVFREPDEGGAERIGMVVAVSPRRDAKIRIVRASGRSVAQVAPGTFGLVTIGEDVAVAVSGSGVRGHGRSGKLGILIDARGRPLSLPERDGERIPAVARWNAALEASADGRSLT
jgi:hypothetical protein